MYGTGLPILYLVSVINFTLTYAIDKYLLLRFYRKPTNFDERPVLYSI
jgi:hypothetical protein